MFTTTGTTFSFSHMSRDERFRSARAEAMLALIMPSVENEGRSPTCSIYAMARTDERSMSRDELAQSMPCEEEEDKVKTKDEIQLF